MQLPSTAKKVLNESRDREVNCYFRSSSYYEFTIALIAITTNIDYQQLHAHCTKVYLANRARVSQ